MLQISMICKRDTSTLYKGGGFGKRHVYLDEEAKTLKQEQMYKVSSQSAGQIITYPIEGQILLWFKIKLEWLSS